MKRICFVSLSAYGYFNDSAPAGGGSQRQFHLLSTNLPDHFDVHFVVGDYGQPRTEQRDGVTLHRAYNPDRYASTTERLVHLWELWRALRRADADVYITRCFPRKLAVLYPLLFALQRPLIFHVAGDPFVEKPVPGVNGLRRLLYERALENMSDVVAQTEYQAAQLDHHWDISAPVVPNGYPSASVVDTHEIREYFLWVGRIDEEQKRPHLFLDIARDHPEQTFVLVGPADGHTEYTEQVQYRAAELNNVTYTGPVAPDEIHEYYQKAIALVNTSAFEGFPNTFLEAWRYATPVVSLSLDPGRFLTAGADPTGFANGSVSELSTLVDELATSPEFRRDLGVVGMDSFLEQYQLDAVVESYRRVIEDVLESE